MVSSVVEDLLRSAHEFFSQVTASSALCDYYTTYRGFRIVNTCRSNTGIGNYCPVDFLPQVQALIVIAVSV